MIGRILIDLFLALDGVTQGPDRVPEVGTFED